MFDWFKLDDFLNGITAEAAGILVEVALIVKAWDWLEKRRESRRLTGFRGSTRRMISRTVDEMAYITEEAIVFVTGVQTKKQSAPEGELILDCPSSPTPLCELRERYDQATRDFADRYKLLDMPTIKTWELITDTIDDTLSQWSLQRLSEPRLVDNWNGLSKTDFTASLEKAPEQLLKLKGTLRGIWASLGYAHHLSHDVGKNKEADRELLESVERIRKDPTGTIQGALIAEQYAKAQNTTQHKRL